MLANKGRQAGLSSVAVSRRKSDYDDSGEQVVPTSNLASAIKLIKELQSLLGKKP
ncbi:hypothetical protein GKR64_04790 [Providencia sp. wls1938]|nr:hypothetical protein [Providencia sp. wls1938]